MSTACAFVTNTFRLYNERIQLMQEREKKMQQELKQVTRPTDDWETYLTLSAEEQARMNLASAIGLELQTLQQQIGLLIMIRATCADVITRL